MLALTNNKPAAFPGFVRIAGLIGFLVVNSMRGNQ
jgi:hypothetical protein